MTYKLQPSPLKNKKMRAIFKYKDVEHHVDFGHIEYQDYRQHRDKVRRNNYLTRSGGIKDKAGHLTKDNVLSPNYWSRRILWNSREKHYED